MYWPHSFESRLGPPKSEHQRKVNNFSEIKDAVGKLNYQKDNQGEKLQNRWKNISWNKEIKLKLRTSKQKNTHDVVKMPLNKFL